MDNGLSSLVAGKRRRDGYVNDNEDVKENLKASRPWYGSNNNKEGAGGGHSSFVPSLEALNNVRSSSGKHQHDGSGSSGVSLNMEQRVMAAAALQDLRGITESSKVYYQQAQKYAQPQLINTSDGANITIVGDSSSTVGPPLPVPLPPLPYIRTPPLLSEAETHNGSPSSSSSGPYPASSLQQPPGGVVSQYNNNNNNNGTLAATAQRAPPVQHQQLPELESESSFSSLMQHAPSQQQQSNLLQQQQQGDRASGLHGNAGLASYQRDHEFAHGHVGMSQNAVLLQSSRSLVSNGVAGFHHGGHHALPPSNGFTQNGSSMQQQVLSNVMPSANQLPHGDSQRVGSNAMHQRHSSMASSSHHHHHHHHQQQQQQQGVHASLPNGGLIHQQQAGMHAAAQNSMHHRMHNQEELVQFQNGLMAQSNLAPQQPSNHCSSSNGVGAAAAAAAAGCSSGVQHHQEAGFSPLHGDFHQVPNSWYPSSMRESTTVSETQQQQQPSVSTSRLLLPPSAGINSIPCLPQQQISQVQNGFGEPQIPDQDHSSSSAVNVANGSAGALDEPALVQRALMRPPPRLTRRSYTKVYKLGSITRAVDVNRFKNYTELRCGLAHMFNLEGQLDQKHGWQLIFTDNEDDLLLVGDDPWEEFVKNVRAIRILTPAEVFYYTNEDKWTAATYNSNGGSAPKLL